MNMDKFLCKILHYIIIIVPRCKNVDRTENVNCHMGQNSSKWCWASLCPLSSVAAPLSPSLCEGSIQMTLACCPLSWISLTLWPPCSSLKSQSRKTPALICHDWSACHPDSIWRTETSCLEEWEELFMLTKNTLQLLPSSKMIGQMLPCKSAVQLALLTFVSIIPLVSPKRLDDWSLRAILVCISGCVVGQWK